MKKIKWMTSVLSCLISMFIVVATNTQVTTRVYIELGLCIVIAVVVFLLVDQISSQLTNSVQRYGEKYKVDFTQLLSEQIDCFSDKQEQYISQYKEEVSNVYNIMTDVTANMEKACKETALEWKKSNVEMRISNDTLVAEIKGSNSNMVERVKELSVRMTDGLDEIVKAYKDLENSFNKYGTMQQQENNKFITKVSDELGIHSKELQSILIKNNEKLVEFSTDLSEYIAGNVEDYKDTNSNLVQDLKDTLDTKLEDTIDSLRKESRRNVKSIEETYETWSKDTTAMLMKLSELFMEIQKSQNNLLLQIDRRQENYQLMSSEELSIMKGLLK